MFYYRNIGDMWLIFNDAGTCVFESDNRSAMFLHAGFNGLQIARPH